MNRHNIAHGSDDSAVQSDSDDIVGAKLPFSRCTVLKRHSPLVSDGLTGLAENVVAQKSGSAGEADQPKSPIDAKISDDEDKRLKSDSEGFIVTITDISGTGILSEGQEVITI